MTGDKFLAGFSKLNITPPFGCDLSGFIARKGVCRGVHDPLWARALVLSDGGEKMAIVAADLIGLELDTVQKVRVAAAALTGIPPERIMIGAIHTHSGPVTIQRGFLGKSDPDYLALLVKNLAGAVYLANQTLEPMGLSVGQTACSTVGKNRRHPGGPTDPDVSVLRLDGDSGYSQGRKVLLVNYACHPVVLGPDNLMVSADYTYYLIKTLEAVYPGAEILFFNGASGDINVGHTALDSIRDPAGSKRTFAEAERLGRILAGNVVEAVETAEEQSICKLRFASRPISLPLEKLPAPETYREMAVQFEKQAREYHDSGANYGEIRQAEVWVEWAKKIIQQQENNELPTEVTTEIAAFSIGNTEFITFPGEFLHELGLMIKRSRPERKVFILGYCNDEIGYVAPADSYTEGGYEINDSYRYYALPAKLAQGAGEQVVEALKSMLGSL